MSGVQIVRALLLASPAVVATCPAAKIVVGSIPQATVLPAISLMRISHRAMARIDANATHGIATSRVQVTVAAKEQGTVESLLVEVRKAANFKRGTLAGLTVISVLRDTEGPDMENDAATIQYRTIDFMVTFDEPN